jgi:hypothetical protein
VVAPRYRPASNLVAQSGWRRTFASVHTDRPAITTAPSGQMEIHVEAA